MSKMNTPQTMMFTSQLLAFIQSRTFGMNFCARVWNSRKSSSGSAATRMVAPMNGNAEKNPDLELPSIGWLLFLPDSSPNDWIASCPTVVTFATRLLTEPLSPLRRSGGRGSTDGSETQGAVERGTQSVSASFAGRKEERDRDRSSEGEAVVCRLLLQSTGRSLNSR